jgi:hypothetical protein
MVSGVHPVHDDHMIDINRVSQSRGDGELVASGS